MMFDVHDPSLGVVDGILGDLGVCKFDCLSPGGRFYSFTGFYNSDSGLFTKGYGLGDDIANGAKCVTCAKFDMCDVDYRSRLSDYEGGRIPGRVVYIGDSDCYKFVVDLFSRRAVARFCLSDTILTISWFLPILNYFDPCVSYIVNKSTLDLSDPGSLVGFRKTYIDHAVKFLRCVDERGRKNE